MRDPQSGVVSVDGIPLTEIGEEDLAAIVSVVSQETYLVHDTIRANLLLAQPDATEAQVWAALGAAQVADLVAGLPDGFVTVVGSRGTPLLRGREATKRRDRPRPGPGLPPRAGSAVPARPGGLAGGPGGVADGGPRRRLGQQPRRAAQCLPDDRAQREQRVERLRVGRGGEPLDSLEGRRPVACHGIRGGLRHREPPP